MNVYTYVGTTQRFLASGRPITFGTELQESDLALADDGIKALVFPIPSAAPAPAETPASESAPQEVVTTGNPSQATPEPEAI